MNRTLRSIGAMAASYFVDLPPEATLTAPAHELYDISS
jgi:hypothetical protein